MSATLLYRMLIAVRGCWLVVEWFFGWGATSHVSTFSLTHPYATLVAGAIAVGFWLTILAGMWFFQRWARLIFVIVGALALLAMPFRVHRFSISTPPSFVPQTEVVMLLVTAGIVIMSFLTPIRQCYSTQKA